MYFSTLIFHRNVVVLDPNNIKSRNQNMDDLEGMMHNRSLRKTQVRGALLEYFNHTGNAKLPAIWLVLS